MPALLFVLALLLALPARAESVTWEHIDIPARFSTPKGPANVTLEAVIARPDSGGPFPLIVLSHGTPREADARKTMMPTSMLPQALEFARRGWAVIVPMRRGYGLSGGDYAEYSGSCEQREYIGAGLESAEDLREVVRFAGTLPSVDTRRVVAVGQSAGGFASVALAMDPPPGLKAVISFAGGRGSRGPDDVCQPDRLADAFEFYATRGARVPMLWLYAENDHFFGPALARRLHAAFTAGGGRAELLMMPPYGEDGHFLFSRGEPSAWLPPVERFLAANGLQARATPIPPRPPAPVPAGLAGKALDSFPAFQRGVPHKAFATAEDGAFGWRSGLRTLNEARDAALATCRKFTAKTCRVVSEE